MKIDAEVKINTAKGQLKQNDNITVPIEQDFIASYDELVDSVEDNIWKMYGVSMFNDIDFTITNEGELKEEIFS